MKRSSNTSYFQLRRRQAAAQSQLPALTAEPSAEPAADAAAGAVAPVVGRQQSVVRSKGVADAVTRAAKLAKADRRLKYTQLSMALLLSASLLCGGGALCYSPEVAARDLHNAFPELVSKPSHIEYGPTYGSKRTITSTKTNNLLMWKHFNVPKDSYLTFAHADDKPVSFLNVVKGSSMSRIDGVIQGKASNVNFYLINPHGITLGPGGDLHNLNSVYLGTAKPRQELLDQFKSAADKPALTITDIEPNLNLGRGMGRVTLLGQVQANDLRLNGSQLVIGNMDEVFKISRPGEADDGSVKVPDTLKLYSSTNRIDIGGKLGDKVMTGEGEKTFAQYLESQGYSAVADKDIAPDGSLPVNQYVDHSGQYTIQSASDLNSPNGVLGPNAGKENFGPDAKYWLADDIILDDWQPLGTGKGDGGSALPFQGSIDGAYHTIQYGGEAENDGAYGLFAQLHGAEISNLKIAHSEWSFDGSVKDLSVGALAGVMKDTTLKNVVVEDFTLSDLPAESGGAYTMGALAGKVEGTNTLSHVQTSYNPETAELLAQASLDPAAGYTVGTMMGSLDGSVTVQGLVVGAGAASTPELAMSAVGKVNGSLEDSGAALIATTLAQGYEDALARGENASSLGAQYVFDGEVGDAAFSYQQKGFLRPFFIEDFIYTYDGKEHDYQALVENEGFALENYITKVNADLDYKQTNAADYGFILGNLRDHDDYLIGHDFYFDYAYSNEHDSWQNPDFAEFNQGRADRAPSLTGTASLLIKPKKLTVDIADQVIDYDDKPDLSISSDTISNYDEVQSGMVEGETIADLDLSLSTDGGSITGSWTNSNYDVTFTDGTLAINMIPLTPAEDNRPKPEPTPEPSPNPDPMPQPEPSPDDGNDKPAPAPQPQPEPDDNDLTDDTVHHVRHALVEGQTALSDLEQWDLSAMALLSDFSPMHLESVDYGPYIMAAISRGVPLSELGKHLPETLPLDGVGSEASEAVALAEADAVGTGSDFVAPWHNYTGAKGTNTKLSLRGTMSYGKGTIPERSRPNLVLLQYDAGEDETLRLALEEKFNQLDTAGQSSHELMLTQAEATAEPDAPSTAATSGKEQTDGKALLREHLAERKAEAEPAAAKPATLAERTQANESTAS